MGLDMYLEKEYFVGAKYEHRKVAGVIDITVNDKELPVNFSKVSNIVEEVGYWRKANAIHAWFVDNVQDGVDDCGRYYVSRDKLKELLETVNKVLDSIELVDGQVDNGWTYEKDADGNMVKTDIFVDGKTVKDWTVADELLPTRVGFFFGGTGYDEYYVDDLKLTKKIIEDALEGDTGGGTSFFYQSSW